MDDTALILAYGTFAAAVVGVLLIVLSRGVDRKRYLRPVVYGFFFGAGCNVFFGGWIVASLMGGAVTGYLLARDVGNWWSQFRAGALNGVLIDTIIFLAIIFLLLMHGASQVVGHTVESGDLFLLYGSTIFTLFREITMVGVGAMLGGMLRKLLKPPAQKPSSGSGVGQEIGKT